MILTIKKWLSLSLSSFTFTRIYRSIIGRLFKKPILLIEYFLPWGFYKKNRLNINSFKNIHSDKRCFIIANGPSLKKIDFSLLKNEYTIGMNRIYLMKELNGFVPTYLMSIDGRSQIQQFHEDFDDLLIPCFFNFQYHKLFSKKSNQFFILSKSSPKFSKDISKELMGFGCTVTYAAIQMAYFMGFKEVYLIGKDHSYNTKSKPGNIIKSNGKEGNHFIKGYYKSGMTWDAPDYKSEEFVYKLAKKAYENNNRIINDATINGELDIFDKVDFQSLFSNH